MKKRIFCCAAALIGVIMFASCSAQGQDEPTTGDEPASLVESASGEYDSVKIDPRVPMKASECDIYLDAEHDSEKTDGDDIIYYKDSSPVMKKTYSAGKLVSKSIYGEYEIKLTYTYTDDGKLASVNGAGEAGDGSFTKISISYRGNQTVKSYAFLSNDMSTGKTELYSYDFDENGKVIKGYDNYETFSEALNSAILSGIGLE